MALAASGGDLYVGGYFTDAAGIPAADRIAKWNGSAWSALGSNGSGNGALKDWVYALAVSGGDLYVGGVFTDAAGVPEADKIAKVKHVLDNDIPTSSVVPLAATQATPAFRVDWSGSDATSGIASFDIQSRDDGYVPPGGTGTPGTWTAWQTATSATFATFTGIQGHRYCFRSRATDKAGNVEDWPADPDTCTRVSDTGNAGGEIVLAGGAGFTDLATVKVGIYPTDTDITAMRMSEDASFSGAAWQTFAASSSVTLSGGDGPKTLYAELRDADGNVSATISDSVTVDTVAPTGTVTIDRGALSTASTSVWLTLTATDDVSGISQYRLSNDGLTWGPWIPGGPTTTPTWTLTPGDGTKSVYAQFGDAAGNISLPASDAIDLDTTVASDDYGASIDRGAVFTSTTAVVLSIAAPPGTSEMLISNDGGFAGAVWEPFSTARAWAINAVGSAVITDSVYVRFRDATGAPVPGRVSDDIVLDPNPPTAAAHAGASIVSGSDSVRVLVLDTRATDDRSGVAAMMLSNAADFAGASWEPYAPTRSWPIESAATTTVYLRFRDAAGNISRSYKRVLTHPSVVAVPTLVAPVHLLGTSTLWPTFRWTAVPGTSSYQLQVSVTTGFVHPLAATVHGTSYRFAADLLRSTTYYWRVRVASGSWSPPWRFRTPAADAPTLLSPADGSTAPSRTPALRWTAVTQATHYQVQTALDGAFTIAASTYQSSGASLTLPLQPANARSRWRVRAYANGAWGAWSEGSSFVTPALSQVVLCGPAPNALITLPALFDWGDVTGATSYAWQLCGDSSCTTVLSSQTARNSVLSVTTLRLGTSWWRVRAVRSGVTSPWSDIRAVRR